MAMPAASRIRHISQELKSHAPFTIFGAILGIAFMLVFRNISHTQAHTLFALFHPGHVLLSAMVTASLFKLHRTKANFLAVLIVGYVGSIGIATLSDSVIPFMGEKLLGLDIPTHSELHSEDDEQGREVHKEYHGIYLGFIEEWYIVNPAALLGILIAWFLPRTKFPHAAHVLISTWASSAHILMNAQSEIAFGLIVIIFVVLFIAVWVPCCISDIIFPLLFVESDLQLTGKCLCHSLHSHPHVDK